MFNITQVLQKFFSLPQVRIQITLLSAIRVFGPSFEEKRPVLVNRGVVMFHHNNARPHMCNNHTTEDRRA